MEATDVIRQNRTRLQHVLTPHILFILRCVREEKLLAKSEYANLKSTSPPSKAAADLVGKMVSEGETACRPFLRLLRDARLTDVCPGLKAMPWCKKPTSEAGEVDASDCGHTEERRLFCEDERRLVCRACDPSHHPGHTLIPVERAVENAKDQLESDLRTLKDKMDKYERFRSRYAEEVVRHNEEQVRAAERRIRAEFERLRRFLAEEEEARLEALRDEGRQKAEIVRVAEEQISSLASSICAVERELLEEDGGGASFLCGYENTRGRTQVLCETLADPPDPAETAGALVDVAKHLGNLAFNVWEKLMRERVEFSPVVLDPNTAYAYLRLSEDLTAVRNADRVQWHPGNPERFVNDADVLGSEGYDSGTRSWDVEVGDHPCWNVGVAKESVERKSDSYSSPEHGIWCLCRKDGRYSDGRSVAVPMQRSPARIRVRLDYTGGEVSFYDTEDMSHIYTHKDAFNDKLYPYFSVGEAGDAQTADIKVCLVPGMEEVLRRFFT